MYFCIACMSFRFLNFVLVVEVVMLLLLLVSVSVSVFLFYNLRKKSVCNPVRVLIYLSHWIYHRLKFWLFTWIFHFNNSTDFAPQETFGVFSSRFVHWIQSLYVQAMMWINSIWFDFNFSNGHKHKHIHIHPCIPYVFEENIEQKNQKTKKKYNEKERKKEKTGNRRNSK